MAETTEVKDAAAQNQAVQSGNKNTAVQSPATQKSDQDPVGFFQDQAGNNSSMRLMCFVSLLSSILFGGLTLWLAYNNKTDNGNGVMITFGFLVGAFAPKAVQKFAEQNLPQKGAQ